MSKWFVRRPSPATVIASIALFVSLGGVSYGVATGSIDSREIKNNNVRSKDLRNDDIRGVDIRNGTVLGEDVASNSLTGDKIVESSLGAVPVASRAATAINANNATNAANASNAQTVGGLGASAFQRKPLWANVEPDGTIAFQSGGITLSRTSTGLYFIHFGTRVANKLVVATPRTHADTTLFAFPCGVGPGAGGAGGTCNPAFDQNTLLVRTRTTGGTDADRGFFVGVFP